MNKHTIIGFLFLSLIVLAGCKKENFVKENTNPEVLSGIEPEKEFLNATIQMHQQDFEAYYDLYRRIMPWMQMSTDQNGNSKTFITDVGNFNQRYGIYYPTLGAQIADLKYLVSQRADSSDYVYMTNIADILNIYYAFYVSDINGSIPFTEAFEARYGGTVTPKYNTQQELFAIWNTRLKEIATTLKTPQSTPQVSLGVNDLYYGGDVTKWVKAANALRLRIAFRLTKRDENTAKSIFADVLADDTQMESNADSWVFYGSPAAGIATSGSNWDIQPFRAPRPTVNFMLKNSDPRIRDYYEKNNYTQANINLAIDSGLLKPGTVEASNRYVGAPISPDSTQGANAKYRSWFVIKQVNGSLSLDTISYLKRRLWNPDFNGGTGYVTMPVINYADYCFMRAEIAARNYVTIGGTADEWYYKGIEASIRFYDAAANKAQVEDYTAVSDAEITAYEMAPDVQFNASKALEQIAVQSYINFYKQPNEAWALWKRTGMPNSNTALAFENIMIDGSVKTIPRRAAISLPAETDPNYANKQAAITEMEQDPSFGSGPTDVFGRVWWDAQ